MHNHIPTCPECKTVSAASKPLAMTIEDYQRALDMLDKREGLTDEQKQQARNQMESALLPAISPTRVLQWPHE